MVLSLGGKFQIFATFSSLAQRGSFILSSFSKLKSAVINNSSIQGKKNKNLDSALREIQSNANCYEQVKQV